MIHCESESAVLRTRFPESLVICRCRFTVSESENENARLPHEVNCESESENDKITYQVNCESESENYNNTL